MHPSPKVSEQFPNDCILQLYVGGMCPFYRVHLHLFCHLQDTRWVFLHSLHGQAAEKIRRKLNAPILYLMNWFFIFTFCRWIVGLGYLHRICIVYWCNYVRCFPTLDEIKSLSWSASWCSSSLPDSKSSSEFAVFESKLPMMFWGATMIFEWESFILCFYLCP